MLISCLAIFGSFVFDPSGYLARRNSADVFYLNFAEILIRHARAEELARRVTFFRVHLFLMYGSAYRWMFLYRSIKAKRDILVTV